MVRGSMVLFVACMATTAQADEPTSKPEPEAQAPDRSGRERALELHDEAKRLYANGKYGEAIARLEEAVTLDPEATILHYNLGLIEEKRGELQRAIGHYRACLQLEQHPAERDNLERTIARLEGALRAGEVDDDQADAAPTVASLPPPPPPSRSPSPYLPWVVGTGTLALASFATAAALGGVAHSVDPGDEPRTGPEQSLEDLQRDADRAHEMAVGADVMAVVGGAATVATLGLALAIWLEEDDEAVTAAWSPRCVSLAPWGAEVAWRF